MTMKDYNIEESSIILSYLNKNDLFEIDEMSHISRNKKNNLTQLIIREIKGYNLVLLEECDYKKKYNKKPSEIVLIGDLKEISRLEKEIKN